MQNKDQRRMLPNEKCPKCGKYAMLVGGACMSCQPEAWWHDTSQLTPRQQMKIAAIKQQAADYAETQGEAIRDMFSGLFGGSEDGRE